MSTPPWVPEEVPQDKPNVARMYDYYLGGHHNFSVDRRAAEAAMAIYPDLPLVMRANRAFLRRAVRFLAARGVEQFLDIGSGIPTAGNVHEVAQQANPAARVAYVDVDPVAVAHAQALLGHDPLTTIVRGDVRQPAQILAHPQVRDLLDWTRPVGVLLLMVLHFVPDDEEAHGAVRVLRERMPPGSYLAISHAATDDIAEALREQMMGLYTRTSSPITSRSRDQIGRFFEGLELVAPGLVYLPQWRPDRSEQRHFREPERSVTLAGVGRQRRPRAAAPPAAAARPAG
jgi:hypothetical protein